MDTTLITSSAIVGLVIPSVIDIINREKWSSQLKAVSAFVLCLLASMAVAWWDRTVDWHNIRVALPIVFTMAFESYGHFWKPSGISDKIMGATG